MRIMHRTIVGTVAVTAISVSLVADIVYVGKAGKPGNPGTEAEPFATIQEGVDRCGPGDECVILPGIYRETVTLTKSGTADAPIRIRARGDVVLDGAEPLVGTWEKFRENVVRVALPGPAVEQAFSAGMPLSPARWPNARFEDTWIRSKWATSGQGSKKDLMVCDALAGTGIDWAGAIAVLNVGHQYKTWTRKILTHGEGNSSFTYALEERLGDGRDSGRGWWNDRFYITGSIQALDAPGEWFHDAEAGLFCLVTANGEAPAPDTVRVKRRAHGIVGDGVTDVQVRGLQFFGCTVRLSNAQRCVIEACDIRFPSCTALIGETMPKAQRTWTPVTGVVGSDNVLKGLYVAYASGSGIQAAGSRNRVEDCIVHDVCWSGTISFAGISITPRGSDETRSTVSRCTVYNVGNIGISYRGRGNVIEYNHVHHTGLACHDIAAIHTGSPRTAGSTAHHNWVHHSMGKGMRGDDQTRELTVHHNLVWNCDEGIIVKGDRNKVYHNTILGSDGHGVLLIPTRREPKKWWTPHEILPVQNANSLFFNNYCEAVTYRNKPLPQNKGISHNMAYGKKGRYAKALVRAGAAALGSGTPDARPRQGSPVVDQGKVVEGLTNDYAGAAPDVGAYEFGEPGWTAGARRPVPEDIVLRIEAEVARTWGLTGHAGGGIPVPAQLRKPAFRDLSKRLQTLYDTCWKPDEIDRRRDAIQSRMAHPEDSAEYKRHHSVVVELHQLARQRLVDRAPTVLSAAELKRFDAAMGVARDK